MFIIETIISMIKTIIIVAIIGPILVFIIALIQTKSKDTKSANANMSYSSNSYFESSNNHLLSNQKHKIGAEISENLNNDIQSYCRKNSITVSDLIRMSVRSYMDRN